MITFLLTHKVRATSPIAILVSFRGKKYRKLIRESCATLMWNDRKKRVKVTATTPEANLTNNSLDKWEAAALGALSHFKDYHAPPSSEEFFAKVDEARFRDAAEKPTALLFTQYLAIFIERYRDAKSMSCIKKYTTALNKLLLYEGAIGRSLAFEDINIAFYNAFKGWFLANGYSTNYFGNMVKVIKQVYREAHIVDRLHELNDTEHRDFVGTRVETDSIYLTEEELERLDGLDLSPEALSTCYHELDREQLRKRSVAYSLVRDRFLIGAYTGLRVSDFARIGDINFDKFIRIKTKKTGADAVIPIHPVIRGITARGFDASVQLSDQKINKHIKAIARLAGITERVLINRNVGGENIEELHDKCDLVCTHTARRSFATNAYKAGVPTIAIMCITGHTKEATFLKYIKVTNEENAELLSSHPFFKGV